jgi:UDP-N-acetylglucosamine 1-carboxyvinyltransferase
MERLEDLGVRFHVEGGHAIAGTFVPAGNKNETLPALAAALLAPATTVLENVPRIADVTTFLDIVARLGAKVAYEGEHEIAVDASTLSARDPDRALCGRIRGSFLLAPALLHRTGKAVLPRPGGDRIGRRRIDTHLLALRALGAEVDAKASDYRLSLGGRFRGADVFLDEASVMATENAVMAAAVAQGRTRIMNAACEPHVQGLCRLLVALGAHITGIGTNCLEIEGVDDLRPVRHRIAPDHIEIGSFVALAAITGGALRVRKVIGDDLRMIRMVYRRLGVATEIEGEDLIVPPAQELMIQEDLDGAIPKVDDAPWPGFPADLTSLAVVLAARATGTVLIHEKMFESRLFFVDRLIAMGARVVLCDPHRALVVGPSRLHGETIASPDIRAGMALLAAALAAEGRSIIMNAHQVDRGYERIDERLRDLGAVMSRTG